MRYNSRPSWWIVLEEKSELGLPWGLKLAGWMPRAHTPDDIYKNLEA
jgi:hypothetical protein